MSTDPLRGSSWGCGLLVVIFLERRADNGNHKSSWLGQVHWDLLGLSKSYPVLDIRRAASASEFESKGFRAQDGGRKSLGSRLQVEGKESQNPSNSVMGSGENKNKKGRRKCRFPPHTEHFSGQSTRMWSKLSACVNCDSNATYNIHLFISQLVKMSWSIICSSRNCHTQEPSYLPLLLLNSEDVNLPGSVGKWQRLQWWEKTGII